MIPRNYDCQFTRETLQFTGDLVQGAWGLAAWSDPFVDIEGDLRPSPPLETRVKMLWDESFLYIGANMQEPHLWATLTEHDCVIFQDNDFEIFIDPDGDCHNYFEIEINALNTTWDLHLPKPYRDKGTARNEWEIPGFRSQATLHGSLNDPTDTDDGWTLETAIPWAALQEFAGVGLPPLPGDIWRINFSRVEWDLNVAEGTYHKVPDRPEHNWVWSPMGVVDMHRPERWGTVYFAQGNDAADQSALVAEHAAREAAMRIYYRQREYRTDHGRWSRDAAILAGIHGAAITLIDDGYFATVPWIHPVKGGMLLTVTNDSRLTNQSAV